MNITLLTYGTRGDVQPFVALGAGLRRAGHTVRLAAPEQYAALVARYGLEFTPLPGDPAELSQLLADKAGRNPVRTVQVMSEHTLPLAMSVMQRLQAACQGAQAIVHSFLMAVGGHAVARDLGVPDFSAQVFPVFAHTAAFPSPAFPDLPPGFPLRGLYNRLTHDLFTQVFWQANRMGYRYLRRKAPALPARLRWPFVAADRPPTPILYGFSPSVIPPPPDWGQDIHVTGYWFLDEASGWQPPPGLLEFLEAGPPPVGIGFGSMITREVQALSRLTLEALAMAGQRGVLLGGWGDLGGAHLPETVIKLDAAPHDWLFPRLAAVAHHGGAGTTAAGLRAGVPSILTPFTADQPFWGRRVARLGVGPQPVPRGALTAERLAAAITAAVTDHDMQARAAALGEKIRAEDGVGRAVEVIG